MGNFELLFYFLIKNYIQHKSFEIYTVSFNLV